MSRALILLAALVAGTGTWLLVRNTGDSNTTEQATENERVPGGPTTPPTLNGKVARTATGVPIPVWERRAQAVAAVKAADGASVDDPTDSDAPPTVEQQHRDHAAKTFKHGLKSTDPAQQVDRAVQRLEAGGEVVTKQKRAELVKQLASRKRPAVERVKGEGVARETVMKAECTGPDAQTRYARLGEVDRMKMRQRCAKFGFVPAQ